jgi:hypothetical protein
LVSRFPIKRYVGCGKARSSRKLLYEKMKHFELASKIVSTNDAQVRVLNPICRLFGTGECPIRESQISVRDLRLHTDARTCRAGTIFENYRGCLPADAYVVYDTFFTNSARGLVDVSTGRTPQCPFIRRATDQGNGGVLACMTQLYAVGRRRDRAACRARICVCCLSNDRDLSSSSYISTPEGPPPTAAGDWCRLHPSCLLKN